MFASGVNKKSVTFVEIDDECEGKENIPTKEYAFLNISL